MLQICKQVASKTISFRMGEKGLFEHKFSKKKNPVNPEQVKKQDGSVPYYKIFKFASKKDILYMVVGLILSIVSGGLKPLTMIYFGTITGEIVEYASYINNDTLTTEQWKDIDEELFHDLIMYIIYMSILVILSLGTSYVAGVLFSYSAAEQLFRIRTKFLERALNQDISWYDTHQTGDFATIFTENLNKVEDGIGEKICIFAFLESTFIIGIILSLIQGWELTLICMVSLPLSSAIMGAVTWISKKFTREELESYGAAGAIADEVLSYIRTVVAFDGQAKEIERYEAHLQKAKKNNIKRSIFNAFSNGCLWFFIYACYALSFWYGVRLIIEQSTWPVHERVYTPGTMISVFFTTLIATWHFTLGAPFLEIFGAATGGAFKVFEILNSQPAINTAKETGTILETLKSSIEFKNVYFDYPSRPDVKILQGFSLKIKKGETVAVVGSSGSGKSTCIQLLQRFYDPINGTICIDDVDIKEFNLKSLRHKIGVVGQEPTLFAATISENIRFGHLNASEEDIQKAAERANAHKFIMSLPNGYDTLVGERGSQLSGGQKQRIAIARALVREPEILLLDEATSALDTTSEKEVQSAIDQISTQCTTIIVAHRLSTIRKAHRIIVVSEGKVIEEGTHSDLMDLKENYYNLVSQQGYEEPSNLLNEKTKLERSISLVSSGVLDSEKEKSQDEMKNLKKKSKGTFLKIIKMNSPEWFSLTIGCLTSLLIGASIPIYAVIFGDVVGILADNDKNYILEQTDRLCLYFLLLGILTGIATFIQIICLGVAGENLTMRLRKRAFESLLHQELGWYDQKENGVGSLCAKLSGDASNIQGACGLKIGATLNSFSTVILCCMFSFYYEWRLTLVILCFTPLVFLPFYLELKIINGNQNETKAILENSTKVAVEAISNIKTVASLGCEEVFYNLYVKELTPFVKTLKRKSHFRSLIMGVARTLPEFAYTVGMLYGGKLVMDRTVEYGAVFKVLEGIIAGAWSVANAFAFSSNFSKGMQSAQNIFELLDRTPLVRNIKNATKTWGNKSNIEYNQVFFSYPTRSSIPVLTGLDLLITEGKTVALVGSSGCGKSTIIQLLERFYDPLYGEVDMNGRDIKTIDLTTIRSHLGIVSQEPNLFDRTIAENIAYGANYKSVTMEEIIEVAKAANIHNFISALPQGYETKLGTKGTQLSGGQKQRIAIARALIRNPKVLLLDEATSALDHESEKLVQAALDKAKEGRTCIVIAHRLTTIQDADVICVMKDGKVSEMGSHKALLEKQGLYYNFYKLQSGQN